MGFNEGKVELDNSEILTWLKSEYKNAFIKKVGNKFKIECESSLEDEGEYYDKVNIEIVIEDDLIKIEGKLKRLGKVVNRAIDKKWSDIKEISALKTIKDMNDAKKFIKAKISKYCS